MCDPGASPGGEVLRVDWPAVWRGLATALRVHLAAGRRHLLTEDVVRFATVTVLADHGVSADRLAAERTIPGVGRIDLLVDVPGGAAVEFKFPREPNELNAPYTMTYGELLKDFYRLAAIEVDEAWAVQLLRPAFARYLARRREVHWTMTPGHTLRLPEDLAASLPQTARRAFTGVSGSREARAECAVVEPLGDDVLVACRVCSNRFDES